MDKWLCRSGDVFLVRLLTSFFLRTENTKQKVNKTVTEKEGGGYLTKYRGEHLEDCMKMQRAQMAQESLTYGQALSHREQ